MSSGQIVKEFLIESFENLSNISDQLTQYENDKKNLELLNSIYRKVHTLKGSANFLGYKKLQEITHRAENILDLLREQKIELSEDIIDVLLKTFDCCQNILQHIEQTEKEGDVEISHLVGDLKSIENGNKKKTGLKVVENPPITSGLIFPHETQEVEISSSETVGQVMSDSSEGLKITVPEKSTEVSLGVGEENSEVGRQKNDVNENTPTKNLADSVVRVNVELLDKIMNVVGELVLNRNQILQYAGSYESSELNRLAQQLNGITTELQTDIMTTRMQPVGTVFSKFERVIRDLSRTQNKKIKLNITGKETELDKTLLDAIRDPLTHLIRNAADHGVEDPATRKQSGKPEEGTIEIKAYHEGGQVTIEIQDDGKGLDPDKIAQKAISKGIARQEEIASMSKKQIQSLIMMPGFSTAEKVTNISGRGVGMDVVKSNIEKIGGSVDITSGPGSGSTFKLKIPLTLAIVPALVVEAHQETFAVPQVNLVELVRVDEESVSQMIEKIHEHEFYRLRGHLIPIFRLGKELEIQNEEGYESNRDLNIVVLSAEGVTYGLIVDEVLDTQEIVVKPLGKNLKSLSVFAGATIMGDGRVSLIVDALGFFNKVSNGSLNKTIKKSLPQEEGEAYKVYSESKEILLATLGDQREYGVPLVLVSRLEELLCESVEWSGDRPLVRYREKTMPLISLEQTLGLEANSILTRIKKRQFEDGEKFDCVVVKIGNQNFGLAVHEIKDIAVTDSDVSSELTNQDGFMGTVFVAEKTITVLDVHEILKLQGFHQPKVSESKGRILLVEDSPLYQKILSEFFIEQGYAVVVEENGKAGLKRLQQEDFDLVVTDIEMPEMNGWEMASAIRQMNDQRLRDKPIVAVSTRVSDEDLTKGVESGFTKHLEKFDKDEVLDAVKYCLAS